MDALARRALQNSLVRLSQGARTAFTPAFAALWPLLSNLCGRILHDAALGEDAAQSALLNIFARADELDPERDAVAWAVGIAAWECKTLQKQIARRHERSEAATGEPHASLTNRVENSPEAIAENRAQREMTANL